MTKYLLSTFFGAVLFIFFTHQPEKTELTPNLRSTSSEEVFEVSPPPIPTVTLSSKKAFPTAQGYGRYATGGRGGKIVAVTNLNSSGSGSLDAALKMTGRRIIVFKVSGTITHSGSNYLDIPYGSGNVTVAGETAPGDGILIKGGEIRISASNVIIRGLRVRQSSSSSGSNEDCINISAYNGTHIEDIIIDHCSLSWARDENLSLVGNFSGSTIKDVTIQNCIIAESDYGLLSYKKNENISVYGNLFIHNRERNIRSNHPQSSKLQYEMINNLVHGASWRTNTSLGTKFTVLNNKYKASGKVSSKGSTSVNGESDGTGSSSSTHAFIKGNIQISGQGQYSSNLSPYIKSYAYKTSGLVGSAMSASQLDGKLLPHVGASFAKRDAVDSRLISQYKNGTGSMATSGSFPYIAKASAPTDKNSNHLPDSFESAHGITSNTQIKANYNFGGYQVKNNAGYTALEIYMAYKAGDFDRMSKTDAEEVGGDKVEEPTESENDEETTSAGCSNGLGNEDASISLSSGKFVSGLDTATATANETNGSPCALALTNKDSGQPWAKYHIPINLSANGLRAGDKIFFSLDGKDKKSGARVKIAQDNTSFTYLVDHGYGSSWSTYSKTITIPSGISTLDIWLYTNYAIQSGGSAVFDNLIVKKVSSSNSNDKIDDNLSTDCPSGSITPEYSLDGSWSSGQNNLNVAEGTNVVLSMLPNGVGLTVTLPNGTKVGDNYKLGSVTEADSGRYILTSEQGCQTTLNLTVGNGSITSNCPSGSIIPEYYYNGSWKSGQSSISVEEGKSLTLSMLPNSVGLTIRKPNGSTVGDNHQINDLSSSDSGTYVLISETGCQTTLNVNVTTKSTAFKARISEAGFNSDQLVEMAQIESDKVLVYPNPVQRNMNITLSSDANYTNYILYSLSGIAVREGIIEPDETTIPVDVSNAQRGLLVLRVFDNQGNGEFLKVLKK